MTPEYHTRISVDFPSFSLPCFFNNNVFTGQFQLYVNSYSELDTIIGTELRIPVDSEGKRNISYKFESLPEIAMTKAWTGPITAEDWTQFQNCNVAVDGAFNFSLDPIQNSNPTSHYKVKVKCLSTILIVT